MYVIEYDRLAAADYAKRWALGRNPRYYDFENIGGDCTNFVSQCIFAGCGVMNYTKDIGWYFNSLSDRAAAWTSVDDLYRFLITNQRAGPFGEITDLNHSQIGDIVQLSDGTDFYHSCVITGYSGGYPYVCAHTYDALNKPLINYHFNSMRVIHIIGANSGW